MPKARRAFLSYAWESDEHKAWVRALAERLRGDGVETILDQWHTAPGDQLPEFMERAVRTNQFVLIVCTPTYRRKSNGRKGGVGYEGDIMTAEVLTARNRRKFIPVLRTGTWEKAAPHWLLGSRYINLSATPYSEAEYAVLRETLLGTRAEAPPVAKPKALSKASSWSHVQIMAVLQLITDRLVSILAAGTFSEMRRVYDAMQSAHRQVVPQVAALRPANPRRAQTFHAYCNYLADWLSETNYVLPYPADEKFTNTTDKLKEYRYFGPAMCRELRAEVATEEDEPEIQRLLATDGVWQLIGHADKHAFWRWVSPKTEDLWRSASAAEKACFRYIVAHPEFTEAELLAHGFTKGTAVEVLNALMRDSYVLTDDWKSFRLSPLGREIVSELIA